MINVVFKENHLASWEKMEVGEKEIILFPNPDWKRVGTKLQKLLCGLANYF